MTIATLRLVVAAASALVALAVSVTPILAQSPGVPGPAGPLAGPGQTVPTPGMASAPPRDSSARPVLQTGTGAISGRVVALDTGLPLRRARVSLFIGGHRRTATTDADGAFAFSQLPAGRCDLSASKPRYFDSPFGARRLGGPGKPLQLAEGQTVEGLVLALPLAGVITGRIVDDAGEPLPGVDVEPMRYRTFNGVRQLTSYGRQRQTDDTGSFRIFGLPPGKYYLSARVEEHRFAGDLLDAEVTGFAPTFYPGTAVAAEAQPIEVTAGSEVVADLQIVTARLTTVTGIVVDPAGVSASGGFMMVSFSRGGGSRSSSSSATIRPDGTFTVTGLAPGEYTLVANPTFGSTPTFETAGPHDLRRRFAAAPIVANGDPIAGLRLVVQDPIRIPVHVTFEGGGADRPERVMVTADSERGVGQDQAVVRDGQLALEVVPGTYRLSAGIMTMASPASTTGTTSKIPWLMKRLSYRGREVEGDAVDLTAEPGGRVDIIFTARASQVEGGVIDDGGKPAADCMVIILPERAAEGQRSGFRRMRVVRPDGQGRFRAEHLPPGDYVAAALAEAPFDDIEDVDFLDGVRRVGKAFTLGEGATATVALMLAAVP